MRIALPSRMQVLHNRNFRVYWLGQLVSLTGTWMQMVAQGWLVLTLTNSVAALGVVNLAFALPNLVLSLTGGVAADRWDRRRIMIVTQTALMLIALAMAALIASGHLSVWLLILAGVLSGTASAYDMPAQQALVPDLVSPGEIPQAIAMNQVIFNGSRLLGPAVAGVTIARFGVASAYLFNGLSFIAVIASLLMITLPAGHARGGARGPMMQALREGLGYVRGQPLLRALMAVSALSVLLTFPVMAVLPPGYVRTVLGGDAGVLGLLMSASGAASMLGALAMLWIPAARRGLVMAGAVVLAALAMGALALSRSVWLAPLWMGALSLGFSMYMGLNATTIQQMAPGALRGRVMSVSGLTFSGMMPVGGLLMGFAASRFGFSPVYLVTAALYVVVALALLLPSGILGYVPPAAEPAHEGTAPSHGAVREPEAVGVSGD